MITAIAQKAIENIQVERLFPLARLHSGHIAKLRQLCKIQSGRLVLSWKSNGQPMLRGNGESLTKDDRRALFDELKALRDAVFTKKFACSIEPGIDMNMTIEIPIDGNQIVGDKVLVNGYPFWVTVDGMWIMRAA